MILVSFDSARRSLSNELSFAIEFFTSKMSFIPYGFSIFRVLYLGLYPNPQHGSSTIRPFDLDLEYFASMHFWPNFFMVLVMGSTQLEELLKLHLIPSNNQYILWIVLFLQLEFNPICVFYWFDSFLISSTVSLNPFGTGRVLTELVLLLTCNEVCFHFTSVQGLFRYLLNFCFIIFNTFLIISNYFIFFSDCWHW